MSTEISDLLALAIKYEKARSPRVKLVAKLKAGKLNKKLNEKTY